MAFGQQPRRFNSQSVCGPLQPAEVFAPLSVHPCPNSRRVHQPRQLAVDAKLAAVGLTEAT